jgi:hypothetical protein
MKIHNSSKLFHDLAENSSFWAKPGVPPSFVPQIVIAALPNGTTIPISNSAPDQRHFSGV